MTVADGARRVDIEKLRVIKTYVKLFLDIFFGHWKTLHG